MKPAPFTLHRPGSLTDLFDVLQSVDDIDDVKLLAGGQSLVPMLALRLAQPAHVVDITGLGAEFAAIEPSPHSIRIGALSRHRQAERSPVVARRCPLLREAIAFVGHPAIRNNGTVGGSLAHADPAAELPAVTVALDAQLTAHGPDGPRTIPASGFFEGFFTTALRPDELLVSIELPDLPPGSGSAFVEVSRRHGDFAMVGAAATVTLDGDRIASSRLALAGVSSTPVRVRAAEEFLRGAPASHETLRRAAQLATTDLRPPSDAHASANYRRHIASVISARALTTAWVRARRED
jgi:aerobic carbon-monoxide dehydrogenase medium subunit